MAVDWRQLLDLAPLVVSAIKPGSPEAAAFNQGYMQSMQRIEQQRLQERGLQGQEQLRQAQITNLDADNRRADEALANSQEMQALNRLSQFRTSAQPMVQQAEAEAQDPTQAQAELLLGLTQQAGARGLPATATRGLLPNMTQAVSRGVKADAAAILESVEKKAKAAGEAITDASISFPFERMSPRLQKALVAGGHPPGQPVKPSQLDAFGGVPAQTPSGAPYQPAAAVSRGTESERAQELLAKIEAATAAGDRAAAAKFQRQYDQLIQAKRDLGQADDRAPRERERLVQIEGPDGKAIWVYESQAAGKPAAQAARAITGMERQTLAFFNRAKEADDTADQLEELVAGAGLGSQFQQQYAPNLLQTADQQRYRQAQRAFTEARLRKESGAAIPIAEYENDARTYFAQPGDSPEVRAQKRLARQTVLDGLKFSAGRAYDEFYGEPPARAVPASRGQRFEILGVR